MTTVAITDYASLASALNDFTMRAYAAGEIDRFIGLAEAEFRLYLGPNFAKESSVTLSVTSGSAPLPAGFVRALSLLHTTYGDLTEKPISYIRERRVFDTSGVPDSYAITGSTVEVAPTYTGDLTFDYEGTLAGLSGTTTTNWLITNAPQAYLSMCLSMEKVFQEDWQAAAVLSASSMQKLADLGLQSIVAQSGRSAVRIPGATP